MYTTKSDTETILHLYEDHAERCVEYLNGMFAIAIWDKRNKKLFLARDRIGIKPLYYGEIRGAFLFGSEIKSILEYPGFPRELNYEILGAYLSLSYTPSPYSMFKHIHKLPPAHILIVKNRSFHLHRYWRIYGGQSKMATPSIKKTHIIEIEERLTKSVKNHLISDVPIGAFLSGGVDSSTIVSLMSRSINNPIHVFTMDFEGGGNKYSEIDYAIKVGKHCNAEHNIRKVQYTDLINLIQKLAWHFDEPFADSSMIPTFLISKFARERVKVVLTGDGGDELFGGYSNYRRNKMFEYFKKLPYPISQQLIPFLLNRIGSISPIKDTIWEHRTKLFNKLLKGTPAERHANLVSYFNPELRFSLTNDYRVSSWDIFRDLYKPIWDMHPDEDVWNRIFRLDLESYLPDDILTKIDRTSMANSLEARVPFLDHEFVEYICGLPSDLKLHNLKSKYSLKKLAATLVPPSVIYRRKQGFSIPLNEWLRNELHDFSNDLLLGSGQNTSGIFQKKNIEKILQMHMRNERNFGEHIWALMIFELWHSIFMKASNMKLEFPFFRAETPWSSPH